MQHWWQLVLLFFCLTWTVSVVFYVADSITDGDENPSRTACGTTIVWAALVVAFVNSLT